MTLLLGIAAPWGMWLSSDHRLTDMSTGQLITDSSIKHLAIKAPDGRALLAYTGFGRVRGQDVSDWLRKTLRGEDRGLEAIGQYIAERATDRLGDAGLRLGVPHVFAISAFLRGEPFVVLIANTDTPLNVTALRRTFIVTPIRVVAPVPVMGGGGVAAITAGDRALLTTVAPKKPRRSEDFQKLLAEVNRRAAKSGHRSSHLVSQGSVGSYLPANPEAGTPEAGIQTTFFGAALESASTVTPFLNRGLDMTEWTKAIPRFDRNTGKWIGNGPDDEALRRMVTPED